eukprot:1176645-Prorocentrum_minimum.AAC.2
MVGATKWMVGAMVLMLGAVMWMLGAVVWMVGAKHAEGAKTAAMAADIEHSQLSSGLSKLSSGLSQLSSDLSKLSSGLSQFSSGLSKLSIGLSQLSSGLFNFSGGLSQFNSVLFNFIGSSSHLVHGGVVGHALGARGEGERGPGLVHVQPGGGHVAHDGGLRVAAQRGLKDARELGVAVGDVGPHLPLAQLVDDVTQDGQTLVD